MDNLLDYESIEIYLGDRLRRSDNLDIHADHFFPVTLLDKLFHYSEAVNGTERDGSNRSLHRNFHGHDFDRWIDNIVARTQLQLLDDENNRDQVALLDIDAMSMGDSGVVTVVLPDETSYTLVLPDGRELSARSLNDLEIRLDLSRMFSCPPVDSDSEPYMGFGQLAHIVRVVCDKSGIDVTKVDQHDLSGRIFEHFKNELLPLIPSLWNDMEHVMHYAEPLLIQKQ